MKAIAAIAVLVLGVLGWNYAVTNLHMGAPDWYANYPCPAGTHLKTWWVPAGPGAAQETYVWHGWREIGGCADTLTITAGTR